MAPKLVKIPAANLKVGTSPNKFPALESKAALIETITLQPWQSSRFHGLKDERFRSIDAFMGSGKSTLIDALAINDVHQGYKVLVIAPRHDVIESFAPQRIDVPGLGVQDWNPTVLDPEYLNRTEALKDFLRLKGRSARDKALVCTHQLAANVFHELQHEDCWEGLSLYIDESQKILSNEDEELRNRIGAMLVHVMGLNCSRVTTSTATPFRYYGEILTAEQREQFTYYPYAVDEHLEGMNYLRSIKLSLVMGPTEAVYRGLMKDGAKTITWLPPGQKAITNQTMAAVYSRLAPDSINLVEKSTQKQNLRKLIKGIRKEKEAHRSLLKEHHQYVKKHGKLPSDVRVPSHTPRNVVALQMLTEGADWPSAERGILLAPRGSAGQMIQMLGRAVRDWPGKPTVEVCCIVDKPKGKPNPDEVKDLFSVLIGYLVFGWQMQRRVRPAGVRKGGAKSTVVLNDPKVLAGIVESVFTDVVISNGDPKELKRAMDKAISRAVKNLGGNPKDHKVLRESLADFFHHAGKTIAEDAQSLPDFIDAKALASDKTGMELFHYFAITFGCKTLSDLRDLVYGKDGIPMTQLELKEFIAHLYRQGIVSGAANENDLASWMKDSKIRAERDRWMANR